MTVSRVTLPPIPAVEGGSDGTPVNRNDLDRSRHTAEPQGEKPPVRPPSPKGARGKLMANIERANKTGTTGDAQSKKSADKTWNAGFAVACELMEALGSAELVKALGTAELAETLGTPELENHLLRHFEKMIGPQATQAEGLAAAASLVADAINWLQTGESPRQKENNTAASVESKGALLKKLKNLQTKLQSLEADNQDSDSLGFYAVMAVMSAAPKLTELIGEYTKKGKIAYASALVNKQVHEFTEHVASLLKSPAPNAPLNEQLISMARAAMKVPFEYLIGMRMFPNLSKSMNNWSNAVPKESQTSQTQLEKALHSFIDARIKPGPNTD